MKTNIHITAIWFFVSLSWKLRLSDYPFDCIWSRKIYRGSHHLPNCIHSFVAAWRTSIIDMPMRLADSFSSVDSQRLSPVYLIILSGRVINVGVWLNCLPVMSDTLMYCTWAHWNFCGFSDCLTRNSDLLFGNLITWCSELRIVYWGRSVNSRLLRWPGRQRMFIENF